VRHPTQDFILGYFQSSLRDWFHFSLTVVAMLAADVSTIMLAEMKNLIWTGVNIAGLSG
jgi:hypothetical protein